MTEPQSQNQSMQLIQDQLLVALDSHKQMIGELLNANLQLRTSYSLSLKSNEALSKHLADVKAQMEALTNPNFVGPQPE